MARYGVYVDSDSDSETEEDTRSVSSEEEEDESDSDTSTRSISPVPEPAPEPASVTGKAPIQGPSTSTNSEKIARKARARLTLIKITCKKHKRNLNRLLNRNSDRTPIPHPNPLRSQLHYFHATVFGLNIVHQNQGRRRLYHPHIKEREVSIKKFKLLPIGEVEEMYGLRKKLRQRARNKKRRRADYWDEDDDEDEEVERNLRCKRIKFADGAYGYLDTTKRRNPTPDSDSENAGENEGQTQTHDQPSRKKKKKNNRSEPIWSCPVMRTLEFVYNCIPTVEDLGGGVATSTSIPGGFPDVSDSVG